MAKRKSKTNTISLFKYSDNFKTFKRGEIIFREGDEGKSMYVVKDGTLELTVAGRVIETLERGDVVGEMALFDSERRSATLQALTDCQITPIDSEQFLYLVRQTPNFAREVMQVMATRLRRMNRQADILMGPAESAAQPGPTNPNP